MSSLPFPAQVEELGWFAVDSMGTAGGAKRAAVECAERLGFDEHRAGEVAIVVAELTSNLFKHAANGWIALRCLREPDFGAVEVIAVDSGPGMGDLALSARDGRSTAGTLGIGLGAVRRLSSRFDAYTLSGAGTVLVAQLWPVGARPTRARAEGLTRPMAGEKVCGDRFAVRLHDRAVLLMVADGLGHGALAGVAAAAAVEAFHTAGSDAPGGILEHVHRNISHTRGAAVSIARIDEGSVHFAGLGNVIGTIALPDGHRRGMVSMPGIVGHQKRAIREFAYEPEPGGLIVLHSDGVSDRWSLRRYPGLSRRAPLTVAATLLRDAGVRRDDACVLVAPAGAPP